MSSTLEIPRTVQEEVYITISVKISILLKKTEKTKKGIVHKLVMSSSQSFEIDDSSAESLWRMYSKAKASLPYKERMQNLTWRMMSMKMLKEHAMYEREEGMRHKSYHATADEHQVIPQRLEPPPHISTSDEYLDFGSDIDNAPLKPKVTSNLTKFFMEQHEKEETRANDPTSDDFDYVAHIKKIGQEEPQQNLPPEPYLLNSGMEIPNPSHPPTDVFNGSTNNAHSFSSHFNNNSHHLMGSYMDSPGNDVNSYMDPMDTISSSYEVPTGLHHASSFSENSGGFLHSVYGQSPASSTAPTPSMENGSFFDSYFGGSQRNGANFASQLRTVSSVTNFSSMDATNGRVHRDDVPMIDEAGIQSQLSASVGRKQSTSSAIKKKQVASKLTKSKRASSTTQLSTASVSQKKNESSSNANTRCTNCNTQTTPLWRRNPEGQPLCNACGLFLKLHGVVRPLSLKTDVIKKRQRGNMSNTMKKEPSPASPNKTNVPTTKKNLPKKSTLKKKQISSVASASTTPGQRGSDMDLDLQMTDANTVSAVPTPDHFGFNDHADFQFMPSIEFSQENTNSINSEAHGENSQAASGDGGATNNNWEWLTMAL